MFKYLPKDYTKEKINFIKSQKNSYKIISKTNYKAKNVTYIALRVLEYQIIDEGLNNLELDNKNNLILIFNRTYWYFYFLTHLKEIKYSNRYKNNWCTETVLNSFILYLNDFNVNKVQFQTINDFYKFYNKWLANQFGFFNHANNIKNPLTFLTDTYTTKVVDSEIDYSTLSENYYENEIDLDYNPYQEPIYRFNDFTFFAELEPYFTNRQWLLIVDVCIHNLKIIDLEQKFGYKRTYILYIMNKAMKLINQIKNNN